MKYIPVIGLEVHVELNTKSKMFCGCDNNWFGQKPNTHTCPVCLGLPGALPVPNRKAIESCIQIGLALNCEIPLLSKFDRKNYFYPDLAKGYQISQYDQPFAENGWIEISNSVILGSSENDSRINEKVDSGQDGYPTVTRQARMTMNKKKIRIRRAHMEEDTGKLLHETINGEKVSLIDFNRSGAPLVEIVTEPDFESAEEVKEYLQKLQQIVRYLGVADADMEKGGMRLEPNISLRLVRHPERSEESHSKKRGFSPMAQNDNSFELPSYKVEVKNINSFNFVVDAIAYEIKRQEKILEEGKIPTQETRGWDEDKHMTISQRSKEEAADYRYFPEPDIPPFVWTEKFIEDLRKQIPELPDDKKERFIKSYKLSEYNADLLTRTKDLADYFEEAVSVCNDSRLSTHDLRPIDIANWIINKKIDINQVLPAQLIQQIIQATSVSGISDEELKKILNDVIGQYQKSVEDYKSGKINALMFLVGQAMRQLKGKVKAEEVRAELEKMLQ